MSSIPVPHASVSAPRLRAALAFTGSVPLGVWLAGFVIAFFLIAAIAPELLQTHNPYRLDLRAPLHPPSWAHWLGTDQAGRDLYSRIVEGAVGMVEHALEMLSMGKIVELDDERKAAMVSNLLVVLCGDSRVTPVVNAGSLYA